MMAWFKSRTERERLLILVASGLLGLVVLLQLIVMPVLRGRDDARLAHKAASETAALVGQLQQRFTGRVPSAANVVALDADALRSEAATLAAGRGLTVSRIQPGENGAFGITLEEADPSAVFGWLQDSVSRLGVRITSVSMSESGDGRVRAAVEFDRPEAT